MVSSLLKVLSTGIQNERLYNEKAKSLFPFIKVWFKTARFTTQWSRIEFDTQPDFGKTAVMRIPRKGHLCTRLYMVTTFPDLYTIQNNAMPIGAAGPSWGWTNNLGNALVENMSLSIGGSRMSQSDGRLLEVLDDFTSPIEKVTVMNRLLVRNDSVLYLSSVAPVVPPQPVVPMHGLWFSRGDPANSLPISAINNADVAFSVKFRTLQGLIYSDNRVPNNTSLEPGSAFPPILGSPFYDFDGNVIPGANMPTNISLGDTYFMAEYVYLDQMEAARVQLADVKIPISQHYAMEPYITNGVPRAIIPLDIPNPTRDIYWMVQREEAPTYNAYFLATRDISYPGSTEPRLVPWWPNSQGLSAIAPGQLIPAFAYSDSEPLSACAIVYEGNLVRARTQSPALFRSIYPSYQQKKSPWVNRYLYNYPMGVENNKTSPSKPNGAANLDKINSRELYLEFRPNRGSSDPNNVPRYVVYCWAETYNILRIYGGDAGLMFSY